ncbi:hypothetical protein K1719_042976 [Acacia pycnantha]|nr:hypothetical protein K1719_042976 [Acacia pycnantha]
MAVEGENPYLPSEVIINILKRLPVKSLVRFRAVCKDRRNLLKSPNFIAEHYHHPAFKKPSSYLPYNRFDWVEVYSLRTGSWKEVEFGVIQSVKLSSNPVTVSGAIFWSGLETKDRCDLIVSFDLAMEAFTLLPRPSISTPYARTFQHLLDVYENKVAVLHAHYANEYAFIDLWVLEEVSDAHGKSWGWTKKYSIGQTLRSLCLKCFWRNEIVCLDSGCVRISELEDD